MKICMVVPDPMVKGGIASVVNGYRSYHFETKYQITYVESYCDGSKCKKLLKALKGYGAFVWTLLTHKPDVVHIHSSFGPSFYRKMPFIYMASLAGTPIINHIHGAEFDRFYENASARKQRRIQKVYNKCEKLIALSDEWKERLSLIVPEEKILVLQNYRMIPELTEEVLQSRKKHQILFLGEIGPRKGGFIIPEILKRAGLKEKQAHFVFAGDGKPEDVETIKQELKKQGLTDSVSFPGWVRGETKERLLKESGIFFFPSYNEGMPMAVLEAMAYGMAILTTDVGGIPKLITDDVDGFLCKPGDIDHMARRLEQLLDDSNKAEAFGKAARERAKKDYSRESHMEKLLALYDEIAGKKR